MSNIDDGGPAMPTPAVLDGDTGEVAINAVPGMSLRDWFAGQALAGFMNHQGFIGYMPESAKDDGKHRAFLIGAYSRDSFAMADAMLAARKDGAA